MNRGAVEADTNVGGIVGQVATEYDFDPEDDITLTGTESFDVEQTIKAVIRDSRNYADVTGKKDYVGGIVGKAEYGAVISCESYAPVESTGGSYVGGVAGSASYAIRSCYSMGKITGKIISAESPGKAATFSTVMLITSWICPERVRVVLPEKLRMTVLYMATIM